MCFRPRMPTTAALVKPVKEEFYDLEKDPWQLHDLAGDPTVAVEQKRLATRLRDRAIAPYVMSRQGL